MPKTLIEILPEQGIEVQSKSKERWVAVCPFHEGDRDPSFTIYTNNDTYYCFGCQVWGDPIKFMCEYKGMTPKEAQEYVGVDYEYKKAEKAKIIKTTDVTRTWHFLSDVVTVQYHTNLLLTKGAYLYLLSRGLNEDTIAENRLGYTDGRVLSLRFAEEYRLAEECGLLNHQGFETMAHRITIPNFNSAPGHNSVDYIMSRTVINDKLKYLGTRMPKPVYGFMQVHRSPILFLAEGQFDWLMLKQWGYPTIVLSGSHLPKYHLQLFKGRKVIIVPDNDEVGRKSATILNQAISDSHILDYKALGVKDVGELGVKEDGEQQFKELIQEQEWFKTIHSSRETWEKYSQFFMKPNSSDLIWKQQDYPLSTRVSSYAR